MTAEDALAAAALVNRYMTLQRLLDQIDKASIVATVWSSSQLNQNFRLPGYEGYMAAAAKGAAQALRDAITADQQAVQRQLTMLDVDTPKPGLFDAQTSMVTALPTNDIQAVAS